MLQNNAALFARWRDPLAIDPSQGIYDMFTIDSSRDHDHLHSNTYTLLVIILLITMLTRIPAHYSLRYSLAYSNSNAIPTLPVPRGERLVPVRYRKDARF
jgi:hypothetical protein